MACAILRNALTCMYGNSTSEVFALNPPKPREHKALLSKLEAELTRETTQNNKNIAGCMCRVS